MRVLHVEDEPDIRAVAAIALETVGGWTVRSCANGREALAALQAFAPDLVLLDSTLPDIAGIELLAELRKLPGCASTPVIFVTARAMAQEREQMLRAGALGVIPKPFDPMGFTREIEALLARSRGQET